jgi:hypothetical protein
VNFGEHGKSSGRHSLTSTVKPVLAVSLVKGWLRVFVDLVKGSNRVHWRGFRGDGPGWPRFDRCLTGLTRLIRSLALMTVIKNLGRHRLHLRRHDDVTAEVSPIKTPSAVRPSRITPTRRPPLAPPPCARDSASLHRRQTFPTYSLGPVAPPQVAPFHPCALPSREPDPARPPPPAIAVRLHRRLLRPTTATHRT